MTLANFRIEPFNDSPTRYNVYLNDIEIGHYVTSVNIELLPGNVAQVLLGVRCTVEMPSDIRSLVDIHAIENQRSTTLKEIARMIVDGNYITGLDTGRLGVTE